MLCDDAIRSWRSLPPGVPMRDDARAGLATLERGLRDAQRFVLSPLCSETAGSLADPKAIERSRDNLFLPAYLTWLEWAGTPPGSMQGITRHGVLLIGGSNLDSLVAGWGAYVVAEREPGGRTVITPMAFTFDFPASDRPILRWIGGSALNLAASYPPKAAEILAFDLGRFGAFVGAALALINTPRLAHVVSRDMDAINRRRRRLNRPAVLSWREVKILIDRGELGHGTPKASAGRALHHVRAFLRIQRGRVQIVRPHWRGNPKFGRIVHRYAVLREEDEPGEWQGGPMPGPILLPPVR